MSEPQIVQRAAAVIAQFDASRKFGHVRTKDDTAFYHLKFIRADSIGRRELYAKVGRGSKIINSS